MNVTSTSIKSCVVAILLSFQASADDAPTNPVVIFETSIGNISAELFADKVPRMVRHFIGLATGEKEWRHPITKKKMRSSVYEGSIFHRVIPGFMIQGGDPLGTGHGNTGHLLKDEFHPDLKFDKPGVLAMANGGPNTNGCQFFITVKETPFLDNKYTIIGQVLSGMDLVNIIVHSKRDANDRPFYPITIEKVKVQNR